MNAIATPFENSQNHRNGKRETQDVTIIDHEGTVELRPEARPFEEQNNRPYRAILRAVDSGDWREAHREANALGDQGLIDYVDWLDYQRPLVGHSFAKITRFIDQHPDWPRLEILRIRAEEAQKDVPSPERLLAWFKRYPPLSPEGKIRHAEALLALGKSDEARQAIRQTWREADFGRIQEHRFIRRHHDLWTVEDNMARLDRLLWEGKLTAARRVMGRVGKDQAALAEARRRLRLYRGGVDWAINQVPKALLDDPGLLYERLRWRRRKHHDAGAIQILDHSPPELPFPELWWVEREKMTRRVLTTGQDDLAYRLASQHRQPPGGVSFAEAEWLAGWIALRFLHNPQTALPHFERLYDNVRFPLSRSRAAYWAGRAAAQLGREAEAETWNERAALHPTTFYGQLAVLALAQRLDFEPVMPSDDGEMAILQSPLVPLVRLLARLGENRRIDPFIQQLYQEAPSSQEKISIIRLAGELGRSDLAAGQARIGMRSGINLVHEAYPSAITAHNVVAGQLKGKKASYWEALMMAIIRQESGFRQQAESHAGALGMMQIMPATAKQLSRRIGLSYSSHKLRTDSEYNLTLGLFYIQSLLERYDDSLILALAAYNAGPSRVNTWLSQNGDPRNPEIDSLDWIEKIPFPETRIYVQRVLSNLQVYRVLLTPEQTAMFLGRDLHFQDEAFQDEAFQDESFQDESFPEGGRPEFSLPPDFFWPQLKDIFPSGKDSR